MKEQWKSAAVLSGSTELLAERPKVLVMDDSPTVLEVTQDLLEEGGYDVVTLSSAALLPSVWGQEKPDLALIDVSMPVMEGGSVVELMRRSHLHRCPLVLYSDKAEPLLRELARSCGASGYIRKTHDGKELLRQVAGFLRAGASAPATPAADPGERPLVFVVDDDELARAVLCDAVKRAGAEAVGLAGGEQCLDELRKRRPGLILMDLTLAKMSGGTCCRTIRENRALCDVPVVLISGSSTTVQVMEAWRAGADDFLGKPIAVEQLERKLRAVRSAAHPRSGPGAGAVGPVLLADHSAFFRSRLGHMLECSGHHLLYARSAAEAVELASQQYGAVGAILVDLALPGAPPLELLKTLKRLCAGPVLPLSSDDLSLEPSRAAARLTGHEVMDKRVPCETLVSAVNVALRRAEPLPVCDRVPFFSVIGFRDPAEEAWNTGFSYDLSPKGIFVTTLSPPAPGTMLELRLVFPGRGAQPCHGQVVWSNELSSRATFSYRVGMGVQFTGGDEAFDRMLAQFTASGPKGARGPA